MLYNHCLRVANYAARIASVLCLMEEQQKLIYRAGLFHDIGKIMVEKSILYKTSALTVQERRIIEKHTCWGELILHNVYFLKPVLPIVLHHHERFDGTGYPSKLQGDDIPFGARILSVADAFDAMTYPRIYRKTLAPEDALEELKRCSGKQFDPLIVKAFIGSWPSNTKLAGKIVGYRINMFEIPPTVKDR